MADFGDREMILANFQAFTGIDNLDECIELLNQHDWDLMSCVNSVFANQSENRDDSEDLGTTRSVQLQAQSSESNNSPRRKLTFNVKWKDQTIPVTLDDNESVETLKKRLEIQLGISKSSQTLTEWPENMTVSDDTILSSLNLKDETSLLLLATPEKCISIEESAHCSSTIKNGGSTRCLRNSLPQVKLKVHCLNTPYDLSFSGTTTVEESIMLSDRLTKGPYWKSMGIKYTVKSNIFELTKIEICNQEWSGWPHIENDQTKLMDVKFEEPYHVLILKRKDIRYPPPNKITRSVVTVDSDNEEDAMDICDGTSDDAIEIDDDDDVDDLILTDICYRKTVKELMPPRSKDDGETLTTFSSNFEERYGHCHPHFFIGSLNEALEEANGKVAKERWPLLVYLHNDSSILTNVFCSQVLCQENVVSYISQNFVCWAWDTTADSNRTLLLDIVTQKCGSGAANTVRGFSADQYPLMLVLMKNRSALEVSAVLQGRVTLDELMTGLINAREVFEQTKTVDIREETEREAREMMRREQDEAYQESLRADRAKEEEKDRQENEALRVKKEAEEKAFLEAQTKQAQMMSLEDQLPDEPGPDCLEPISNIRFRMPNNEQITRRFLATTPLQVVLTFVQSKGYLDDQYTVVTNFPRKQLSEMDPKQSLESLALYPQETLFVEEI